MTRIERVARELCIAAGNDPDRTDERYPNWRCWHVFIETAQRNITEGVE